MTEEELIALLRPHLESNPQGIFDCGQFDLDATIPEWNGFSLWLDGDTEVKIPMPISTENAVLIQKVVSGLGRRLLHTWSQQYSEEP